MFLLLSSKHTPDFYHRVKFNFNLILFINSILVIDELPLKAQNPLSEINANQRIDKLDYAPAETKLSFTEVAKSILPSVVSIYCTKIVNSNAILNNQFDDAGWQDLLGEKNFNFSIPREYRQKGSGSGIIVSRDGFILTNLHVIEHAEKIIVKLADNRNFEAMLRGADELTELAIIKISAANLPAAKFGNSDSLEVGEWVLAVGNPLELRSTVTAGIISAIGREIDIIDDNFGIENFIQTDAIINPGSSGGALINLKSEVIGINTAIATQSGLFEGYGFAIPANLAKQIVNDLIKAGFVLRSYLGISMQDVTEKIAAALSLENLKGVFVDQVIKDSPAFNAGLHEQDIILKIDGMEVNQGNIIQSVVARKKPGEKLLLAIQRNKQRLTITLKLGRRPSKEFKMSNKMVNKSYSHYGLKVKTIDISLAQELGLEIRNGVLVLEVEKFSPAYEANIRVSDIILEIDAQKVTSQIAFEKIISALKPGKVIIVKLRRNENIFHRFLEIPL